MDGLEKYKICGEIEHHQIEKSFVSIYLDCYDMLGFFGEPYWELYPISEDTFRCKMLDTDALLNAIREAFEEQRGME